MHPSDNLLSALAGPAGFRTTHWCVVLAVGRDGSPASD